MNLSERNNQMLQRKYKPISISQLLRKPLLVQALPPIYLSPKQKENNQKKRLLKPGLIFSERPSESHIFNKFDDIGTKGIQFLPVEKNQIVKEPLNLRSVILSSRQPIKESKSKLTSHKKINISKTKINLKYQTEIEKDKVNKWCQTTFNEEQLLEYLKTELPN